MKNRCASLVCSPARRCSLWLLIAFAFVFAYGLGCDSTQRFEIVEPETGFARYRAPAPSTSEHYCAWYADRVGEILFFGTSAFWSNYREFGLDPLADLERAGPRQIGRFDLGREQFLSPITLGPPDALSGVWDVLVHPRSGRTFFTSLFERAGFRTFGATEDLRFFDAIESGLNELTEGPDDRIVASRYWGREGGTGAVVIFDPEGEVVAQYPLESPQGFHFAPKTVAYDPTRKLIWVNTDRLKDDSAKPPGTFSPPLEPGGENHPTLVIDLAGRERARFDSIEIQALAFAPDGRGAFALVDEGRLELAILEPGEAPEELEFASRIRIDDLFPAGLDFVQDLVFERSGDILMTRWSGKIHHITSPRPAQRSYVQSLQLPRYEPDGLYYASAIQGRRICATYCSGVSVVCGPTSSFRVEEQSPASHAPPR